MSREVTVVTPENVTLSYELAGLGSRASAQLLDLSLQGAALSALFLISGYILSRLASTAPQSALLRAISDFAAAIAIIVIFATLLGYFIYFEATRSGQTPGKRWLGLRVVREEGAPIDFSAAAIRNLIRVIEMVLGFYLISIVFILFSPKYKRVGDYAAGTMVVKERRPSTSVPQARPVHQSRPASIEAGLVGDVGRLTKDEIAAVRRFVERRWQLAQPVQEDVARQMAEPIMERLGIVPPPGPFSYANFLEAIYIRSVEER